MCVCVQSLQSCLTLCDPVDCSRQAPLSMGILQARMLQWVAISFSRGTFPTQGWNPHFLCLLPWQEGSLPLEAPGKQVAEGVWGRGGCMKRVCQFQGCKADLCDWCLTAFRVLQERIGEGGGGSVRLDHL